jgi:superfamily II DNA helicase RecQ
VAKKASAKLNLDTAVLKGNFEQGQSWLVYCEDSSQLSDVIQSLKEADLDAVEYHIKYAR